MEEAGKAPWWTNRSRIVDLERTIEKLEERLAKLERPNPLIVGSAPPEVFIP